MSSHHTIISNFIQTKFDGEEVDLKSNSIELIRRAESNKKMLRFKPDIFFCSYKTTYENDPSILMLFTLILPGQSSGSSASSELIMSLVSLLERVLSPIDNINLTREVYGNKKTVGIIKIVKKIRENDLF